MINIHKSLLTIFARDISRSVEFYGKTIGLRETYRFPRSGAPMHVEFDAGASR